MVPDYEKIMIYLKERYGDDSKITLYDGKYNKDSLSSADYEIQKAYLGSLQDLGFNIINAIKYLKKGQDIVIKGIEVSLAIDLLHNGHGSVDLYDLAVIMCGDHRKYRKLIDLIQDKEGKKVKTFSFLQEYEDDHPSFLGLLDQLGTKKKQLYPIDKIKAKPMDKKVYQEIANLNPKDIRQRVKSINRNRDINNNNSPNGKIKQDTFIFIDYGNIHHSLYQLKHKNPQLRNFTELDFLLALKNKASMNHNLKKIKLFMGMPQITIKDLESIRSKKEKLITQLKKNDFEVYFTINENKFTGGMKEQGVDLRIAINIIHCALENEFEKVILVSGDADFTNVIKKLRQLNKEIEIWSFTDIHNSCPLSPFLYKEITKDKTEPHKNGIKSLNAMFKC